MKHDCDQPSHFVGARYELGMPMKEMVMTAFGPVCWRAAALPGHRRRRTGELRPPGMPMGMGALRQVGTRRRLALRPERRDIAPALLRSRQSCLQHGGGIGRPTAAAKGGHVLSDPDCTRDALLIDSGMAITAGARDLLAAKGVKARVVSMPCADLFDRENQVLPRLHLAAWHPPHRSRGRRHDVVRYVGLEGIVLGLDRFLLVRARPGGHEIR
jgi:hypothetical protein